MPNSKYIKLTIGEKVVQVTDPADLPISIDYSLEDPDNFETKTSSKALSVEVPATLMNDVGANTFRNPSIKDLTEDNIFRGNQPFTLEENGMEIMKGKAFLTSAKHNAFPLSYKYDFYGDNADWKVELEEATLFDFLKDINFVFSKANIISSWDYDWTDKNSCYCFIPIRYKDPIGGYQTIDGKDVADNSNMTPAYMKPSISKFYILYQAFKSLGYKIQSNFLNSEYFRRQMMPWTWGNFLDSDGTKLSIHNFMAKSVDEVYQSFGSSQDDFIWDLKVSNKSTDGAFDNNGDYSYDGTAKEMKWEYKSPDFGALDATFSLQANVNAKLNGENSYIKCKVLWYKNGTKIEESSLVDLGGTLAFGHTDINIKSVFFTAKGIVNGDVISAKIQLLGFASKLGFASISAEVLQFQIDYFRIPVGGTVAFSNYTGFKKWKFLDFFKGVIGEFNLSLKTDPISKVIVIEPTHSYSIVDNLSDTNPGYFVEDFIDWNGKEDLSQDWEMENYNDYNRELTFKYKNDNNDGILKVVQDRNVTTLAAGKYVFPNRFKAGKSDIENPFFSPTMHYDVDEWKGLGTGTNANISPQMICMIPENVSNTSKDESANTFNPKSIYYKGNISGVGAWKFDGTVYQNFPFGFAVNYKVGGENDPILSYSDENINGVIGKGLLKRYYWQRLAIMRNGQWYNCFFRLKNVDVVNCLHREYKSYAGHRWELIHISGYRPLQEKSTALLMRRWAPVSVEDFNNTFPSSDNVTDGSGTNSFDIKYSPLKSLSTDIPFD